MVQQFTGREYMCYILHVWRKYTRTAWYNPGFHLRFLIEFYEEFRIEFKWEFQVEFQNEFQIEFQNEFRVDFQDEFRIEFSERILDRIPEQSNFG